MVTRSAFVAMLCGLAPTLLLPPSFVESWAVVVTFPDPDRAWE